MVNTFERYSDELYHGVNSFVRITFYNENGIEETDLGYVDKIELNKNIDTITETYIGLYGEPSFNAPTRVEYHGTFKKKLSDHPEERGGRVKTREDPIYLEEDGYLTNSILKFKDGVLSGSGMKTKFDLKIHSLTKEHRLTTIAYDCTITNHRRVMDRASFIVDEYAFKFKRFEQRITIR